MKLVRRCKSAQ